MAGPAHTHWVSLKDKFKTEKPDLYKKFSGGFGKALDDFESAALKKIKKDMPEDQATKAVAKEIANVNKIAKKYAQHLKDAGVDDYKFGDRFFSYKLERYLSRFCIGVANGYKDAKSAANWAGQF